MLVREENLAFLDSLEKKYSLTEEQASSLTTIIMHVTIGTLPTQKLSAAIKENLGIDSEKAKMISLAILQDHLYPFWPLFPDIDATIKELGGKIPAEKPAMPRLGGEEKKEEAVAYPEMQSGGTLEVPELFGGMEIPVPPLPHSASGQLASGNRALERDVPWTPPEKNKFVARPGDISKLLEKNLIQNRQGAEPKIKGNVVDLSQ